MTKSWDDVRDLIYKLYLLDRKSLTETSRIIERDRDFQARAYRMKLKEWGIKRSNVTLRTSEIEITHEVSIWHRAIPAHIVKPRRSCGCLVLTMSPQESVPSEDNYQETSEFEQPEASSSRRRRPTSSSPATDVLYEETFNHIKGMRMAQQVFPLIQNLSFETGTDTLLHYVARQTEDILSGGILALLKCMRMREGGVDIDARDSRGLSPLEIAIRSGIVDNVSVLLAAGASVHQRNGQGEQPLHIALKSETTHQVEICVLILANGADPTSPIRTRHRGQTEFLDISVWDQLRGPGGHVDLTEWHTDAEVLAYCHMQHQSSFGHGTRFNPGAPAAFQQFVNACSWPVPCHPVLECLNLNCIKFFLKMGSTPFVPKALGMTCPTGRCDTLASASFFHSANHACADVLVSSSLSKYAPLLAELLLSPCVHHVKPGRGKPLSVLLRDLLHRAQQYPISQQSLITLLRECPNDENEKFPMFKALVEARAVDVHHRDPNGLRPIQHLLNIPAPLRFDMAETMFSFQLTTPLNLTLVQSTDPTRAIFHPYWPLQPLSARLGQLYAYIRGCQRWRYDDVAATAWHDGSFETCACSPPAGMVWTRQDFSHEQFLELHRCLVHVCTKVIMREWTGTFSATQLRDALRLRDDLILPPIEMTNRTLLNLLNAAGREGTASLVRSA